MQVSLGKNILAEIKITLDKAIKVCYAKPILNETSSRRFRMPHKKLYSSMVRKIDAADEEMKMDLNKRVQVYEHGDLEAIRREPSHIPEADCSWSPWRV